MCDSDTELKTLPSEQIFRHLRAHGAAFSFEKRLYSGVVVSSSQLDFGPEELMPFICANSARAFDLPCALCILGNLNLT